MDICKRMLMLTREDAARWCSESVHLVPVIDFVSAHYAAARHRFGDMTWMAWAEVDIADGLPSRVEL